MVDDEEIPDKSKVQYEHLKRVKEHMAAEEEALKATKIIKGADTKNYKHFSDNYIRPPEMELSDEAKLKVARGYQILTAFIGFVGLAITFFIIYNPMLILSIFENSIIVLKVYTSTLYLSLLENYFVLETNLILLGCALVIASVMGIIFYQHKHDKISDRINAGLSPKIAPKRIKRIHPGVITFMAVAGIGIIVLDVYFLTQYVSILENFIIVLSVHNSELQLSLFESFAIKINLIFLGCVLAVTSLGIIGFRHIKK